MLCATVWCDIGSQSSQRFLFLQCLTLCLLHCVSFVAISLAQWVSLREYLTTVSLFRSQFWMYSNVWFKSDSQQGFLRYFYYDIMCHNYLPNMGFIYHYRLHYILVLSHSGTVYDRFRVCADSSTHIRASIWQVPCVTNSSTLVRMVIWQFPRLWYWYYTHQNEYMTGSGRSRFVGVIVWVINFGSDVTLFNCLQPWMLTQLC